MLRRVLVLCVVLAGCSAGDRFPPACPSLSLLPDASDLSRYRAAGQDLTDLVIDARITAVPARCNPGEAGQVAATLQVAMSAQRGPAAAGRKISLPYFVAVMSGDRVLDQQSYTVDAQFDANSNQALLTSPEIELLFPVTKEKSAAAFQIFVGFVLTPAELALNRRRGAR